MVHADRLDGLRPVRRRAGGPFHRSLLPHDRPCRRRPRGARVPRLLVALRALQCAAGLCWRYHGLEPNLFLRRVGYDWSFATIFPALFLTAAALRATVFRDARVGPWRPSPRAFRLAVVTGAVSVTLPLAVVSAWLVPLVWVGWALLLEPLNCRRGRSSWLADIATGDASRLLALLASGAICGVLWELWNYWAAARWTYAVPYLGGIKIFEMPVLGYLGFPPFALESYAMYHWLRGSLGRDAGVPML